MTTPITVRGFTSTFVEQLNENFAAIDAAIDRLPRTLGAAAAGSLAVGGPMAGNATFSTAGQSYFGDPLARDPTWRGSIDIVAVTRTDPGVVTTAAAHGLSTGMLVAFTMPGGSGMIQLDGVTAIATVLTPTMFSVDINTSAYTPYVNHGRVAPAGTNLSECFGLTVRHDGPGGGGAVYRSLNRDAAMFHNFGNDVGDVEGTLQENGSNNPALSGARSFNIGFNYGDLGLWTQVQASPVNVATIRGYNAGASHGFVGFGTRVPPSKLSVIGADNTAPVALTVRRSSLDYGVSLGTTGTTGNSYLETVGATAQLNLAASGVVGLSLSSTAVQAGLPILTTPSVAGGAGLRIPHGTAPASPVNGDIWSTAAGVFIRINGVTRSFTLA